jgi:hypothetical protein
MILDFYQSKNLDGHLDEWFYPECLPSSDLKNPFSNWYADIFYVHRKKCLIISNELTKFTFFILGYSKNHDSNFGESFSKNLWLALSIFDLDPASYIDQIEDFAINTKSNKSIIAHISRLKEEYHPSIVGDYLNLPFEDQQVLYNKSVNEIPTTFNKKSDYLYPRRCMYEEYEKRGW